MFELPKLPYERTALEPYISAETIDYHHGKHHNAYVTNLNNLILGTSFEKLSLEEIIKTSEGGIFNNAAQVWNHTFYWNSLCSKQCHPSDNLLNAIEKEFGSFSSFKEQFTKAATTLFGSGWAWLVKTKDGKLKIRQTVNADNPLKYQEIALLTCDVWEHAYYVDYRNARPKYVEAFWNIINWDIVGERFE